MDNFKIEIQSYGVWKLSFFFIFKFDIDFYSSQQFQYINYPVWTFLF